MSDKKVAILASTGSIGTQTIEVIKNLDLKIYALTCNSNIELLEKQIINLKPKVVCVANEEKAIELKLKKLGVDILVGEKGLIDICNLNEINTYINSLDGSVGLMPTYTIIKNRKKLALANKEVLVIAGELLSKQAKDCNVPILPIDSEHSAIFQCIQGNKHSEIEKIILTASGGPFKDSKIEDLQDITLKEAIAHPTWSMGRNISINSSTMMNKGFEVIEARWLFDMPADKIEVLVHPQSVVHSMVEYIDGSVIAQLGPTDMRIPIQYALTYPNRLKSNFNKLNLLKNNMLTFSKPDLDKFKCLKLAYDALKIGGTMPLVMCISNEIAINKFINGEIKYLQIAEFIERKMQEHTTQYYSKIEEFIDLETELKQKII